MASFMNDDDDAMINNIEMDDVLQNQFRFYLNYQQQCLQQQQQQQQQQQGQEQQQWTQMDTSQMNADNDNGDDGGEITSGTIDAAKRAAFNAAVKTGVDARTAMAVAERATYLALSRAAIGSPQSPLDTQPSSSLTEFQQKWLSASSNGSSPVASMLSPQGMIAGFPASTGSAQAGFTFWRDEGNEFHKEQTQQQTPVAKRSKPNLYVITNVEEKGVDSHNPVLDIGRFHNPFSPTPVTTSQSGIDPAIAYYVDHASLMNASGNSTCVGTPRVEAPLQSPLAQYYSSLKRLRDEDTLQASIEERDDVQCVIKQWKSIEERPPNRVEQHKMPPIAPTSTSPNSAVAETSKATPKLASHGPSAAPTGKSLKQSPVMKELPKGRKMRGACESCTKIKTKCIKSPDSTACLNCSKLGFLCKYAPQKRRGPPIRKPKPDQVKPKPPKPKSQHIFITPLNLGVEFNARGGLI